MGRGLRLEWVAGLCVALALPTFGFSAAISQKLATETSLTAETHDTAGGTQATISVSVMGNDGQPATGAAILLDDGKEIAGVAVDATGHASATLTLAPGDHTITATYSGDSTHLTSISQVTPVRAVTGAAFNFTVSVSPASLSLTAGQSGTVTASVTPVNASSLTAPMFVTLSCSGLPDQSACTFTPENIEILPNETAPINSTMVLATSAGIAATAGLKPQSQPGRPVHQPIAWAVLLPGVFGFAGLAFGARRRRWMQRLFLLALVGFVSVLGATACSPQYDYYHHGPPHNLPTPSGTYQVSVTAQSSNGVTAITNSTPLALTVK